MIDLLTFLVLTSGVCFLFAVLAAVADYFDRKTFRAGVRLADRPYDQDEA